MEFKEIDDLAKKYIKEKDIMPSNLNVLEQACFISLRALYSDYFNQNINTKIAEIDKKNIRLAYANMIQEFTYKKSQYDDVIKKIRLTENKRVELRKCKPEERLKIALELISLYSGENFIALEAHK